MKVFLDANVLFAAGYNARGLCRGLFLLAESDRCRLVASSFAVEEARRNLESKAPETLPAFQDLLRQVDLVPEPVPALVRKAAGIPLPEKDAPILAAAIASRCDLLVTGDRRHFGQLYGTRVSGVLVLPAADAFDLLLPG